MSPFDPAFARAQDQLGRGWAATWKKSTPPPLPARRRSRCARPGRPARGRPRARAAPEHENFPVASRLIAAPLRAPVRAFYAVVRAADEAADAPGLDPAQRRARLEIYFRATCL
ncbi:hypothetical protein FHS00_003425 [Limimaricola variabilis]|uniref:Uncharacterized protein n=1 Tax=Limimaricola variabilis TaxID=1492771 RepID=A0ABR6HTT3_9RHOB|nr:hypothetical protein [Limimaricola variabilis]